MPEGLPEGIDRPPVVPQRHFVNPLLIVVSHMQPAQYPYLKHVFEKEAIDVIIDRRFGERRQLMAAERRGFERRHRDRRQRDITKDLKTFGWAVVRRRET